eukprot:6427744-Ditylum_brightwellii.AAC.1
MQNKSLGSDLNAKKHTIQNGNISRGGFACEVQHRIRMFQIRSPIVALVSIATLIAIGCALFHSTYVDEYSAGSDRALATKVIGRVQRTQNRGLRSHRKREKWIWHFNIRNEQVDNENNKGTQTPNIVQKSTTRRQLNRGCEKHRNHISCSLNRCTWTRKKGCIDHP